MVRWFVEYIYKYFRDELGRFTQQPRRRRLSPFFRSTLAFEVRGVREGEWESEPFKVMCYAITVGEPKNLAKRLAKFAKRVLDAEFYHWTSLQSITAEAVEPFEQIGRDEISPARLYRAYAEIDDEPVYEEDLY